MFGPSPARASTGVVDASAAALGEYATETGLTEVDAEEELATQQKGAAIVELLTVGLKDDYAGVWFDIASGEYVIPYTRPGDRQVIDSILGELGLDRYYRIEAVSHTWDELLARQESLIGSLGSSSAGRVQVSIAPQTNSVVLEEAGTAAQQVDPRLRSLATGQDPEDMVEARSTAIPSFAKEETACIRERPRHCDAPLRGGVELGVATQVPGGENLAYGVCSAGFKALGNLFANRFILTAGHCARDGEQSATWFSTTTDGEPHAIGPFEEFEEGPRGDFGKIKANGSYWDEANWPSEVTFYSENENYPIDYEAWTYPGESVCFSGQRSGSSCGIVQRTRVTENNGYPQAEILGSCVDHGDSGGPVFSYTSHTGLGLMEEIYKYEEGFAEEGRCGEIFSFYQELPEITTGLGVSVGARIGGAPTLSEGGATDIRETAATLNGAVYPNGVETTYHIEYGTTTSYGTSIPVPDGSAGHGTGEVPVSASPDGLTPGATYHWRLVASSPAGTSVGADQTFETQFAGPTILWSKPGAIQPRWLNFGAAVDTNGFDTYLYFEYGLNSVEENKEAAQFISGQQPYDETWWTTGSTEQGRVEPNTTYHLRATAVGGGEEVHGEEITVTTAPE